MALALFWIAALICTVVATVGAIASTEPMPDARASEVEPEGVSAH